MNKTQLVAAMSEKTGTTKKAVDTLLNAFLDVVTEELKNGSDIQLVGFGSFSVKTRAARKGHNPITKEEIKIPACKSIAFKAGKGLKEIVNK